MCSALRCFKLPGFTSRVMGLSKYKVISASIGVTLLRTIVTKSRDPSSNASALEG